MAGPTEDGQKVVSDCVNCLSPYSVFLSPQQHRALTPSILQQYCSELVPVITRNPFILLRQLGTGKASLEADGTEAMSNSSLDDVEKQGDFDRSKEEPEEDFEEPHLTEQQEDLREAAQPAFTATDGNGSNGAPLENVASAKPSINNIKSVPNGGLTAWLQVLGSFFLFFNTWVRPLLI